MVYLTRRFRFSAGHRLHNEALNDGENARIYGKCNNPNGHGHNYVLEVTVGGSVDAATGFVFDLPKLDKIVAGNVLDKFDHKNLNLDVDNFREQVPTTENLCMEIYNLLRAPLESAGAGSGVRLDRVRLEETSQNSFECTSERAVRRP